jgi:hypothetical protein
MKELNKEREVIRQYLVGGLNEEGRQQIEERVITDGQYKEEVLMIEGELLEDYLAGTLPETEREMFRKHYLSAPRQRQKLRIAQALNKYAVNTVTVSEYDSTRTPRFQALLGFFSSRSRFVQFSWVALLALVLIAGSWILFQTWRSRSEQARLDEELARLNGPQSIEVSPDASVFPVTLSPLSLREQGNLTRVNITPQTKIVQLRIPVTSDRYQSYRLLLRDSAGREILEFDGLKVRTIGQAKLLVLQIPARILSQDDYLLTISGLNSAGRFEDTGDYPFRALVQR